MPRFYLANFIEGGRVDVYDFQKNKTFRASPNNIAVEAHFNDLEMDGLVLSTESWLTGIESIVAPILARLVADPGNLLQMSEEEEIHLSRFMAAQRFRVPALEPFMVLLGEVQGYANLLVAMPWRIGFGHSSLPLYTSDNPVSSWLTPVRPSWSGGAFPEHTYIYPLSSQILLWIDPLPYSKNSQPRGKRTQKDFSEWETSFARHVITQGATRFVFGTESPISRACATACLERISWSKKRDATRLQGFDPYNPRPLPE